MRFECPNCNERCIPSIAKWQSGTENPVVCGRCHRNSCEAGFLLGASGAVQTVSLFAGAILAVVLWTWTPLAVGLVILTAVEMVQLRWAPLRTMSTGLVRQGQLGFAVVFVVLVGSIAAVAAGMGIPLGR